MRVPSKVMPSHEVPFPPVALEERRKTSGSTPLTVQNPSGDRATRRGEGDALVVVRTRAASPVLHTELACEDSAAVLRFETSRVAGISTSPIVTVLKTFTAALPVTAAEAGDGAKPS